MSHNLKQLQIELSDYIHWFNKHRIYENSGNVIIAQYRLKALKKVFLVLQYQ
ncbi:IS3 family transposase [Paenibacillus yanchengensis]|uniref:IS3 family transposase n=1 Tax=Paenibacillus yanchengensis TaxID=2035833 RepID=A0ABW4YLX7_9BACL